jgi:hypothetical protein
MFQGLVEGWIAMGLGRPLLGSFMSKFLLMVVPGVAASALAVFVLYAVHVSRVPEPIEQLTDLTPQSDGLSTEERRELTRQMLKARRENPQEPAQVRPTPTLRPITTGVAEDAGSDAKGRPDRAPAPAAAPLPAARPTVARAKPEPAPATTAAVPAPAVAAPATTATIAPPVAPAAAGTDPTMLPPVVVNSPPPGVAPEPPPPRSFAGSVFSSISTMAGTAANATGNTVNWVIDLPGRAISAGGKLLGGDSASNPPPPAAPPPKRNLL